MVTSSPCAASVAASARARSGERFHSATSRIGRTEACAATSWGASAPAPTISRREASVRDRYRLASAEAAPVRQAVSRVASITASVSPVSADSSR